jgi:hypothetical protein
VQLSSRKDNIGYQLKGTRQIKSADRFGFMNRATIIDVPVPEYERKMKSVSKKYSDLNSMKKIYMCKPFTPKMTPLKLEQSHS